MCINLDPPPLNLDAVRTARQRIATYDAGARPVLVPLSELRDLLAAYDALAARLAILAAGVESDR